MDVDSKTEITDSDDTEVINKIKERSSKQNQIDEAVKFCKLVSKIIIKFSQEMDFYKKQIEESKTNPKKKLYQKKFDKVKIQFIDNLAKRQAIVDLLYHLGVDEHGEPLKDEEKSSC